MQANRRCRSSCIRIKLWMLNLYYRFLVRILLLFSTFASREVLFFHIPSPRFQANNHGFCNFCVYGAVCLCWFLSENVCTFEQSSCAESFSFFLFLRFLLSQCMCAIGISRLSLTYLHSSTIANVCEISDPLTVGGKFPEMLIFKWYYRNVIFSRMRRIHWFCFNLFIPCPRMSWYA